MLSIRNTAALGAAAASLVLVAGVVVTAPASAKSTDVIATGSCTGGSNYKLKAKPDNGALQVEWEVDQNRNGQVWTWAITHDGVTKASGRATTQAPSGSFSVTRRVVNAAGTHTISGAARNAATGEVCRGSLVI
ncbi:hypothetical protein [Longivirga aurantiaca]|uniref:Uncharacterized protein n=1 Tax=Longivirga aurantiaca TaxID=1837743 RepID=A0ABW1SWP2_9ACTN